MKNIFKRTFGKLKNKKAKAGGGATIIAEIIGITAMLSIFIANTNMMYNNKTAEKYNEAAKFANNMLETKGELTSTDMANIKAYIAEWPAFEASTIEIEFNDGTNIKAQYGQETNVKIKATVKWKKFGGDEDRTYEILKKSVAKY